MPVIETREKDNESVNLLPIILSGGSGSRLWPLSRACFPKQYLNLNEKSKYSLLQDTYLRLKGLQNLDEPIIICNEEQRFIVAEQMREIKINPKSIILEPEGRNTAPAISIGALAAIRNTKSKDPILLVLSSDHVVSNVDKFLKVINDGIVFAKEGRMVTFGVIPTNPETGYGYIESLYELSEENKSSPIKRFIEKPVRELAEKFITNKHFTWNSGIFLFKASVFINEMMKFEPKIIDLCKKSLGNSLLDLDFERLDEKQFKKCSSIPIDKAVMEKTNLGTVLQLNAGWSDIGNWKSVWDNSQKDDNGNSYKGKVILKETKDSYFRSENRLIVGLGLENIVAIETNDAILVVNKEYSHKVKNIVSELDKENYSEGKLNRKMYRPWGNFTSIEEGAIWQVKKLEINPEASLSLQMHHHRSEHWVVVKGTAKVEINGEISLLSENEGVYVPLGSKHRLSNPGKIPLVLIEVQSGTYLGEDDILRFDDIYGRKNKS